jgi:hypothetical protein
MLVVISFQSSIVSFQLSLEESNRRAGASAAGGLATGGGRV